MGRSKNTAETLYQGTYGEGTWVCPNDETLNTGEACVICGCKRPKAKKRRWIVWAVATLTVMCFALIALMNYARCEIFGHNWQFTTAWEPETCSVCGATRGEIDKWARAYEDAAALEAAGDMPSAAIAFGKLGWYRDARDRSFRLWHEIIKYNSIADEKGVTVGLRTDGTVVSTGNITPDWWDIISISAGEKHIAGLGRDGKVRVMYWDSNEAYGSTFYKVEDWKDIVYIDSGPDYIVALKSDGTVSAMGNNERGQCNVYGWSDIVAVSAGFAHTVGLRSDGTIVATGYNEFNQCDVSEWWDIVAISAGELMTLGLKRDGTVVSTGFQYCTSDTEWTSCWTDITDIAAGSNYAVGLRKDGSVVAAGFYKGATVDWKDIVAISAGTHNIIGVKADGTLNVIGDFYDSRYAELETWFDIRTPK